MEENKEKNPTIEILLPGLYLKFTASPPRVEKLVSFVMKEVAESKEEQAEIAKALIETAKALIVNPNT